MREARRSILVLAIITLTEALAPNSLFGQVQRPLPPEGRWDERLRPRTPLSGTLIPGVMSGNPDAIAEREIITVRLPNGSSGPVCISVQSHDGRYNARARFQVPAGANPTVLLRGPSRYRNELRGYRASQLLILATLSRECHDERATHVVPHWGTHSSSSDNIYLYVNSRDHADVSWARPDGQISRVRCPETDDTYVIYNRVCRIPASDMAGRITLTVRQRRDGRTFVYDSVFVSGPQ